MGLLHPVPRLQQMFKMSVCLIVSVKYLLNCSTIFIKLGMVPYCHKVMCPVEKLIHYLQCQGHSKGFYNQNMAIFTISSKLLACLQPDLHHKPECSVEKWDYCVQGQGHGKGSKCQ